MQDLEPTGAACPVRDLLLDELEIDVNEELERRRRWPRPLSAALFSNFAALRQRLPPRTRRLT